MRDYKAEYRKTEKHQQTSAEYNRRPEVKAKAAVRRRTPEAQEYHRQYRQSEKGRASAKAYREKPEVKARRRYRWRLRGGRHYPRGWGGAERKWNEQGRKNAYVPSEFDGFDYGLIKSVMETDHLVPTNLLDKVGITHRSVLNHLDNLRVLDGGMNSSKHDKPLHVWLKGIGESSSSVRAGKALYIKTLRILVDAQRKIDPGYVLDQDRCAILGITLEEFES